MIPNLAIIVSAYAVARLLNEYVLESEKLQPLRVLIAIVAILAVVVSLIEIVSAGSSLSDL